MNCDARGRQIRHTKAKQPLILLSSLSGYKNKPKKKEISAHGKLRESGRGGRERPRESPVRNKGCFLGWVRQTDPLNLLLKGLAGIAHVG